MFLLSSLDGEKERKSARERRGFLLLIILIIMAHYENVINNTEDIVVAISHMVVGPCSVTILPLASPYVCQEHAPMTSSTLAHLPSSTWEKLRGLRASCFTEFFMQNPVGLGTNVTQSLGARATRVDGSAPRLSTLSSDRFGAFV